MSDKPTLYVVPHTKWPSGDIAGALVSPDKIWWDHMSSNLDWLVRDLTTSFTERREQLAATYPDGVNLVIVGFEDGTIPPEIAHHFRHEEVPDDAA